MCVRRWRPGDRCVSFHHYLQCSPGEPGEQGVPGRDGLKGEKVGKLQIKLSPQRKIWSYDVLSRIEHARQLVKTPFRLFALHAILNHVVTLCSRLWCLWLLCYLYTVFFSCSRTCSKYCAESGKAHSWHAYLMRSVTCQNKRSSSPPTGVTLFHSGAREINLKCWRFLHPFTFIILFCHLCYTDASSGCIIMW